MKKYILQIAILAVVVLFSSCDIKDDYDEIDSEVVEAAGEWWINYSTDGYESGYLKTLTFNTSTDDGSEIWISDEGNFWVYKVKCPVNIDNLTFSGMDLVSAATWQGEPYDIKINISNGKIIEDAVDNLASGAVADSIYFEIEFEDDPGTIYQAAGFRKTGFIEDEH